MKTSFLDYSKKILEKVSFDIQLFRKELRKSLKMLTAAQQEELINWCNAKFGREYLLNEYATE
jgi:hypothetical protein